MILIHICTLQGQGTEPWCTLQGQGTENILIHISTHSLLGTVPSPYWVQSMRARIIEYPAPAGTIIQNQIKLTMPDPPGPHSVFSEKIFTKKAL